MLIWFGWFGFNGGSALNASVRSMYVCFNTNTAACFGVLGWVMVDYVKHKGKFSVVGACSGAIAGLVGITPAAGFVSLWIAAVIGFLTGAACSAVQNVDRWLHIDEGMDVFKLHGIGGMIGSFLTGIFAQTWVASLDGLGTEAAGAMDGEGVQVGRQLAEICAISAYSFVVSCIVREIQGRLTTRAGRAQYNAIRIHDGKELSAVPFVRLVELRSSLSCLQVPTAWPRPGFSPNPPTRALLVGSIQ